MQDPTDYSVLTQQDRYAIILDRLRTTEAEHFAAMVNIEEIQGIDKLTPAGETMKVVEDLQQTIAICVIRKSNLEALLVDKEEQQNEEGPETVN